LDGKVFKEIEDAPKLPQHPNCRCLLVPLVKGMEEDDEDDTRASEDGPVPAKMTFTDWLKTQPDEFARDILGPVRFSMYKDGTDLSGFVAGNRILTLKQLEAADGLPDGLQIKEQTKLGVLRSLNDEVRLAADFEPNNDVARDIIPEEILVKLRDLHKYDKGDGIEHFSLMDKYGSILDVQEGKYAGVINMPEKTETILKNSKKGALVMAHTHSSSLSFSGHDLFELARFESLDSSRIIGYNGMTYYMRIGDGIRPAAFTEKDKKDFMKIYDDYLSDNLFKYLDRKDITIDVRAYYTVSDTAKDIMKHYTWEYREGKNGR
jgi:hypothetical protein